VRQGGGELLLCEVCTLCADSEFVLDSQDGVSIRNPASPWVTKDTNNIGKQVLAGGGGGGGIWSFMKAKFKVLAPLT
jgi:hypothetical protein